MLLKKDLEKKKQALNQEKSLINERLNARKSAIDEADKYEELAELQRQLAVISADSTRTKDAKELRRQIADLQKEISWDIAQQEADTAIQIIDDQIEAIGNYEEAYEEDLNEMLENSNNFSEELSKIMSGSFEDYLNWMKQYNEAYKNASEESRKQMEQGWSDTWDNMKGYVQTYWDQVDKEMRSQESFIAFMKESQEYQIASEAGQKALISYWEKLYDDFEASTKNDAEWTDNHEIVEKLEDLKDYTYKVEIANGTGYDTGLYTSEVKYYYERTKQVDPELQNYDPYDEYSHVIGSYAADFANNVNASAETTSVPVITINVNGSSSSYSGSSGNKSTNTTTTNDEHGYSFSFDGRTYSNKGFKTKTEAQNAANASLDSLKSSTVSLLKKQGYTSDEATASVTPMVTTAKKGMSVYKKGGLVDFTGPAWVDGTKTNPEAFLSSGDTRLIRTLLDGIDEAGETSTISSSKLSMLGDPEFMIAQDTYDMLGFYMDQMSIDLTAIKDYSADLNDYLNSINIQLMSLQNPESLGQTYNQSIGDVIINVTQANLNTDEDIRAVAKKVGKQFQKEISTRGFNMGALAF